MNISDLKSSRRRSSLLLDRLEREQDERAARRELQKQKDLQFVELLRSLQLESAKETHSVEETKKALGREATEKAELLQRQKVRRQSLLRQEMGANESMQIRLAETFHTLELNSSAHTFEGWCQMCQCFHTSDLVNPQPEDDL